MRKHTVKHQWFCIARVILVYLSVYLAPITRTHGIDSEHMTTQVPSLRNANPSDETVAEPVTSEELLELLGDEYTRRVLEAVAEKPRTGREIIEAADVSKATAYRRLDELSDAGLVTSDIHIDPNGHHCKQFRAVLERATLELASESIETVEITS